MKCKIIRVSVGFDSGNDYGFSVQVSIEPIEHERTKAFVLDKISKFLDKDEETLIIEARHNERFQKKANSRMYDEVEK